MHMTKEDLDVLEKYQENPFVHPLTCGNNSLHGLLSPRIVSEKMILECPDCDYVQDVSEDLIQIARGTERARSLFPPVFPLSAE